MGWFKKKDPVRVYAATGKTEIRLEPFNYCGIFPSSQTPTRGFIVSGAELFLDEMPFSESFTVEIPADAHLVFQQLASRKSNMVAATAAAEPVLQMFRGAKSTSGEIRAAIHDLAIAALLVLFAPVIEEQAQKDAKVTAAKADRDAALKKKYGLA